MNKSHGVIPQNFPAAENPMRLLFVCTGNICRSPTAEAVFRHHLALAGRSDVLCDSAGTHGYHIGEPPDPRTIRAALRRGYVMDDLGARKVSPEDFSAFNCLLALDFGHLAFL